VTGLSPQDGSDNCIAAYPRECGCPIGGPHKFSCSLAGTDAVKVRNPERDRIDWLMNVTRRPVLRWPFYTLAAWMQRRRNRRLWG